MGSLRFEREESVVGGKWVCVVCGGGGVAGVIWAACLCVPTVRVCVWAGW